MSEGIDPARQLAQHVASLRAAGVEWIGIAPPLPAPEPVQVQASLFAAAPPEEATEGGDRRVALEMLRKQVASCTRCPQLAATRTQTVFGVGPLDPEVCFVGEAPGADEDRTGIPFVGAAGQLLDRILAASGLKRDEVGIVNVLRCRPPGNRKPEPDEAANCEEWLTKTLELMRPKLLVALGGSATKFLLGVETGITRLRGRWLEWRGIPVLCTFHPSYLLRNPDAKRDVWEDMKSLLARMGRPVPGK
ncbi:MAG: uracil-DNA glycosylase [Gemmataceae bacterium]|nr:uracil-DNA glycosylase [Gemmataceae bacterium]